MKCSICGKDLSKTEVACNKIMRTIGAPKGAQVCICCAQKGINEGKKDL